MSNASILMARRKNIALAAHDHTKKNLFSGQRIICYATTRFTQRGLQASFLSTG